MTKNTNFWNEPMTRRDWGIVYGASLAIGFGVSIVTAWPLIGESVMEGIESVRENLCERFKKSEPEEKVELKEPWDEIERVY